MRNNNDNKMKRGIIITLMSFILLAQIIFISADGGYFPPPGHYVTPGQQKAVIFYEDNIETLIVTSEFRGNAKDLVWIIPTPTKPEVTKADKVIFQKFDDLTKPQVEKSSSPMNIMSMAKEDYSFGGVYIYESKQVDYYDVNILYATNTPAPIKPIVAISDTLSIIPPFALSLGLIAPCNDIGVCVATCDGVEVRSVFLTNSLDADELCVAPAL